MLRIISLLIGTIACATSSFACEMQSAARSDHLPAYLENAETCLAEPPVQFRFDPLMEELFLNQINAERRGEGLAPLKIRSSLQPAARFHSLDFATNQFFDHQGPDGRTSGDRVAAFDRTLLAQKTGENIAQFGPARCYDEYNKEVSCLIAPGFKVPTPAFVVDDLHEKLMASEGHRANILSPDFTHVAIGVVREDAGFYVTQVFAKPLGALEAPLPPTFRADETLELDIQIENKDVSELAVLDADGERLALVRNRLDALSNGTKTLIVRAEKITEETNGFRTVTTTEWLDLFGPAFVLVAATES